MTNRIIFFLVATSVFIRQESFSHTQFNDLLCVQSFCVICCPMILYRQVQMLQNYNGETTPCFSHKSRPHIVYKAKATFFITHWFERIDLSRPPLAQFSRGGKYHFRSCGFTASYLFEMFFTTREKCCYILIFPNE